MKSTLTPTIVAVVLLAGGTVCWTLGQAEDRVAHVTTQVMTMGYKAVAEDAGPADPSLTYGARVPIVGEEIASAVKDDRASANYWLGRYDTLTLQRDSGGALVERDPQLLLLAANAAYRANELEPGNRQASIQRLQAIVTYYADLVKSHPESFDAAYNYEFTARLRNSLERGGRPPAAADDKNQPTIHGQPGAPAKGAAPNKLNIIVPKSGDERTNSPEAGQGGRKVRKG
ncbi:MAG TPA: hypothetical protein VGJ39_13170 [Vicinamibacterales bacterium]